MYPFIKTTFNINNNTCFIQSRNIMAIKFFIRSPLRLQFSCPIDTYILFDHDDQDDLSSKTLPKKHDSASVETLNKCQCHIMESLGIPAEENALITQITGFSKARLEEYGSGVRQD